eukprot:CAMPEP_0206470552 /NCGR_PEP_ID=MMETSP0324_2-20121206/31005_1 /ASSEMBLY_ACC=CAM_ASM_000836 /TAXON_ID=2866 /ORGANISM="Crypthecodinium cohnii, Strain Seligo" /LENGTH=315 /DNA_ID=CAMNT_0053944647 /DNA_START=306 /DNA_END=1253 /DNA_ORIENTATION=+
MSVQHHEGLETAGTEEEGGGEEEGPGGGEKVLAKSQITLNELWGAIDQQVALVLQAVDLVALSRTSRQYHQQINEPLVRYCAHQRREDLSEAAEVGDLELAETREDIAEVGVWNLERLHISENPPRFPSIYFHFASDEMMDYNCQARLDQVADILRRFPGLIIRIEGYGHPSAPRSLGRAIAQARSVSTRLAILRLLLANPGPRAKAYASTPGKTLWDEEYALDQGYFRPDGYNEGRGNGNVDFYEPRLIGRRLQAVGRWGLEDSSIRNRNFKDLTAPIAPDEPWDMEVLFRRVDFTVVRLVDPGAELSASDLCH